MSLTLATLLTALPLLGLAYWFVRNKPGWDVQTKSLLRNDTVTLVVFGGAVVWFLYKVTQWGEADFGNYKEIAFGVFAAAAVGCWYLARDFLAVRGAAGLYLLLAHLILFEAAYMRYDVPQRLFLVTFIYVGIVGALYLGAVPFRLRDFLDWLYARSWRVKTLGLLCGAYGLLLIGVALSY